jgi:hypothetical protein
MVNTILQVREAISNRTICDLFGVANMGGIRVNKSRNLIVLISNNTNPLYRNEWKDDVLHFVGMGSTGPQKLDRQNRTLASVARNGMTLHLFEVFEKSRYVYAGEVELADEPYLSDQTDARADSRFVWIFPMRRKSQAKGAEAIAPENALPAELGHLPHGAYAVIASDLSEEQTKLVNRLLDQLKEAGLKVFDQRDVDHGRYNRALARWHEEVMERARSMVRELIAKKNRRAKVDRGSAGVTDDELRINSASNEQELRAALKFLDRDDRAGTEEIFERARQSVPMPEVPKSLLSEEDPVEGFGRPTKAQRPIDRKKLDSLT